MRKSLASFLVLWVTAVSAQEEAPPAGVNERVLEELRRLREQVAALEKRIDELDERLRKDEAPRGSADMPDRRGPDREALARIKLPEDPTREQVLEYVRAIVRTSRGQNTYSSVDPQIAMLAKVGRRNAAVLIEAYDGSVDHYFCWAIRQLAGEEHKDVVIKAIADHPRLVAIVLEKGWAADAREILMDALKGRPHYLPTEWIQAVASLRDPATYGDLVAYFIEGMNKPSTHDAIRSLPGIDLESAVAEAWERPRGSFPPIDERKGLAPIAISHGIGDALETAFSLIGGEKWLAERARAAILLHADASGSDEEIKAFYEKNKGRFRWDRDRRKFYVERP